MHHTVWAAGADETRRLVGAFAEIPALYIADGHHRAASAARARASCGARGRDRADRGHVHRRGVPGRSDADPRYNRTVGPAGRTAAGFLRDLRQRFRVIEGPPVPQRKGYVSMYLDGRWYTSISPGPATGGRLARQRLDVALLQAHILEQLLEDRRHPLRQAHRFRRRRARDAALEQAVNSGKAAVAFSMFPVTVDDLMAISGRGRHHAAEVHVVRAQAKGWVVGS